MPHALKSKLLFTMSVMCWQDLFTYWKRWSDATLSRVRYPTSSRMMRSLRMKLFSVFHFCNVDKFPPQYLESYNCFKWENCLYYCHSYPLTCEVRRIEPPIQILRPISAQCTSDIHHNPLTISHRSDLARVRPHALPATNAMRPRVRGPGT